MNFCLFTFPFNFHELHTYSQSYISIFIQMHMHRKRIVPVCAKHMQYGRMQTKPIANERPNGRRWGVSRKQRQMMSRGMLCVKYFDKLNRIEQVNASQIQNQNEHIKLVWLEIISSLWPIQIYVYLCLFIHQQHKNFTKCILCQRPFPFAFIYLLSFCWFTFLIMEINTLSASLCCIFGVTVARSQSKSSSSGDGAAAAGPAEVEKQLKVILWKRLH